MKTVLILILLLTSFSSGNEKSADRVKRHYESMHFIRQGGGQIEFSMYATDNPDKVKVMVSRYNFRNTSMQITIEKNGDNSAAFASFQKAINNQIGIKGTFKQSKLPTGTWAYIYFVSRNEETEVTNSELRDILLEFEQLVDNKIEAGDYKAYYEIAVNEQFQIELISNLTTGYSWTWANKQAIDIVDSTDWTYIPDKPVLTGSGGREVWKFKGVKRGVDSIKMKHCRSWEPDQDNEIKMIVVRVR